MADEADKREGFLARWSRRKRTPDEAGPNDPEEADAAAVEEATEVAEETEADEELAAELEENRRVAEAVDIESLSYEDDFKIFLKRGVPDALRKKALQKLWRSNPVLANLDGLNDYDDDFADPAQNVYKSVWKIGRGFLSELELQAQQDSGRISGAVEPEAPPPEEEMAEAGEDEDSAYDPSGDLADEDNIGASAPDDAPESVAAIRPEDEPERIPRISIRKRLEG